MESKIIDMIFTFTVKEGKQKRYEEVMAEQIAIAKTETGTLIYDIFRKPDGSYCQHERYASEDACQEHNKNTAPQLAEWFELTDIQQIIALGPLSESFKEQFGVENYLPFASANK